MDKRISDIFSYGDDPVFWESCDEISPEEVKALTMRRIRTRRVGHVSRTLLIAAVIVSLLTVSAIAVGLSIHSRRQEQLRQEMKIDENHVDSYTEFPIPAESATDEESAGVVLLSAIKDSEAETVYVSISPIEEEDLFMEDRFEWTLDGQSFGAVFPVYDNSNIDYAPVYNEYTGEYINMPDEEQRRQAILENYDPETKSGLFKFDFLLDNINTDEPLDIKIYKLYTNLTPDFTGILETHEVYESQELGTIHLEPIDASCLCLRYPEPPIFENPDTGGKGRIIGADIYATGVTWIIEHDDMADIYTRDDGTPPRLSGDELRELQFSWLSAIENALSGASLQYSGGENVELPGGVIRLKFDGAKLKSPVSTNDTIDLSRIHSLTLLGETVYVIR